MVKQIKQSKEQFCILTTALSASFQEDGLRPSDKACVSKFIFPSDTALIQPMDQRVFETIKRLYRNSALRNFCLKHRLMRLVT